MRGRRCITCISTCWRVAGWGAWDNQRKGRIAIIYIVLDLEWNGAYSKKAHGYFNEIIDIGAVMLDDRLREIDRFHATIRPTVSRKLSGIVRDLTHFEQEELDRGTTFDKAISALRDWIGRQPAAILTWSNTDLLVFIENFRFFHRRQDIPLMTHYADAQRYCQARMGVDTRQQLGLRHACEQLEIPVDGMENHRALGDSILTARVLQKVGEPASLARELCKTDRRFYERLLFKPFIIKDINTPGLHPESWHFDCPDCGRRLAEKRRYRFTNGAFCADLTCAACDTAYTGRVQCKQLYDEVLIKRKLVKKTPPAEAEQTKEEVQ